MHIIYALFVYLLLIVTNTRRAIVIRNLAKVLLVSLEVRCKCQCGIKYTE